MTSLKKMLTLLMLSIFFGLINGNAFAATATDQTASSSKLQPYSYYMNILIKEAHKNTKFPFAAMIVDKNTGQILSIGLNTQSANPTYHGEIVAINNCVKKYPHINWKNTILITTAEPCPMCMSAIIWAGISEVVFGTSIAYLNAHQWHQINLSSTDVAARASFYQGKIIGGVLHEKTDPMFNVGQ